jgi:ABC-2 type transport system ATP-binding protein
VAILLLTHSMDEAERLADRLALIDRGRLVAVDTPWGLVAGAGLEQQLRFSTRADLDQDWIRRLPEVSSVAHDGDQFVVTGDESTLFSVVSLLAAHDIVPDRLQVYQPSLAEAFAALTGRSLGTPDGVTR